MFFDSLSGEWNYIAGMAAARVGIPSDRIEAAMRLTQIPRSDRPILYADVKAMERAVLIADRELAKDKE